MTRAKIENGIVVQPYPYTLRDLYVDHPDTSFPDGGRWPGDAEERFGVVTVTQTPAPTPTATQAITEALPAFVNGVLTQQWAVRDWTAQEIADAQVAATERTRIDGINAAVEADPDLVTIRKATLAQIDNYIDQNVTNLAEARAFLKRLTKLVVSQIRRS